MRSDAQLDSAVFQLTPTRTRCDLVIVANGKTEKLASGLMAPFLPHLKTAQDQIAKGGYSIILEPDPESDATWFTKGTVERFVRFVSTPEVLERVTTIEKEILQIENAIAIQGNENVGSSTLEDHQSKPAETFEATKSSVDSDAGKAIVPYKPGSQPDPPDSNGSAKHQENSKAHLLKVLETRKMVLRKEQGMAFARAAAAGFDMDTFLDLISFSENFGASRLKEACLSFMDLWKKKHETGQWLEVEAVEAMSMRSEFPALNASGIIFTADAMAQKDHGDAQTVYAGDIVADSNGDSDKKIPSESKVPPHPEYFQGQFQPPSYPQWPMHAPPGPMFQPYPMQGMPYYQNYPGSAPYFHPPYPPMEDPRYNSSRRKGPKRLSMDSKDIESETWERSTQSQDDADGNPSDLEKESSHGHKSHKRSGRSGKKKSGVVVIRNLNYIASQKHGARGSESDPKSASESESEEESDAHPDVRESKHKHSKRISKGEDHRTKPVEYSDAYSNDKGSYREEADSGNWQAFQNFLLNAEEKSRRADEDMFAGEKDPPSKKKQSKLEADPMVPPERDYGEFDSHKMVGMDSINEKASRMRQIASSDDQLLVSSYGRDGIDNQFKEIEGLGGAYQRRSSEEFMIYGEDKQLSVMRSSDPLIIDPASEHINNAPKNSSYTMTDESFLIPYRSDLQEVGSDNIAVIDMDSEIPTALEKPQVSNVNARSQLFFEPDELSMVPDRGMESLSIGYDPAMDYDFELPFENTVKLVATNEEDLSTSTKEEPKKSDKEKNLKASNDSSDKRRDALLKKGASSSSRLNLLTEAQKRAEKLRTYKGDLQKMKKEREEEERKRLEALKREREKRIAARSGSTATQSPSTPKQAKPHSATKPSPSPYKGSKFSDAEPVSSPLRKLPSQISSNGSSDPPKATKSSRLNGNDNGLSRSASALSEVKKGNGLISEARSESLRIKRLSDPKNSSTYHGSTVKSSSVDQAPKRNVPNEPQKKITEIMQLDQSKSTSLPELRIKTKTSSEKFEDKTANKVPVKKESESKTSQVSKRIDMKLTNEKSPSKNDDNHVIEKAVVVLEDNVVRARSIQQPNEILETKERSHGDVSVTDNASIHALPSSIVTSQIEDSSLSKLDELQNHPEGFTIGAHADQVVIPQPGNDPPKFSGSTLIEKPHQDAVAKLSSFEDPITTVSDYNGGLSATEFETVATHAENPMVHVSTFEIPDSGHQTHETHEKPRSKETKGIRKLLKFGRKSHSSTSAEGNLDSDASSLDDQTLAAASFSDVSRSFSLLSPFRSRNSEKKQVAA